jgi:outer membrane protein OmpA-like peptidoglycan-associated protein
MKLTKIFAAATLAGVFALTAPFATPSFAGDLTAEEITNAFNKQKTRGLVVGDQKTRGLKPAGQSGTRGLVIVPTTEQGGSDDSASVSSASVQAAYSAVAKEDQVNVQISFDFDSAALRNDQKPKLATLCQVMQSIDVAQFQIIGHTDAKGSADYNERLSLLRAQEVKRHLVDDCGIDGARLQAVGLGEQAPLDPSDPRAEENRRVEFQALS